MTACSQPACERAVKAQRLCDLHYKRWRKHGDPAYLVKADDRVRIERFWSRVDKTADGCWLWTGTVTFYGYGNISWGGRGKRRLAHRIAYELTVGPIPDGLDLDHLCRVRLCVNPDHLEPVTRAENVRRGAASRRVEAATSS